MAEAIGTEIGKFILERLGSAALKKFMSVKDLDFNIDRLEKMKSSIKKALHDAKSGEASGKEDLQEMYDVLDEFFDKKAAKDLRNEVMGQSGFIGKVRLFLSPSNHLSKYTTAREVGAVWEKLGTVARSSAFVRILHPSGNRTQGFCLEETCSDLNTPKVFGRDKVRDDIITRLCDPSNDQETLSVATIVGIGGQGKTTLAQYVCSDPRIAACFDFILWVSCTPDCSARQVREKIISAINDKPYNSEMVAQLHKHSLQAIVGKNILLVLDNLGYGDNLIDCWEGVHQLLNVARGSKVLITTRSEAVAKFTSPLDRYMLPDLAEDDAWLLFREFAFKQLENSSMEAIGKEIFQMCPKVPLVLRVVGQQLALRSTINQWQNFKDEFAANPSFEGRDKIMGILGVSYDQLPVDLQNCVVCCSLFPKGYRYQVDRMVYLWIALGYVKSEYQSLEDKGQEYLHELDKRGFFQDVDKDECGCIRWFNLHDLIHDLMLWKGRSKYQMVTYATKKIDKNVRHLSLVDYVEPDWDDPASINNIMQLQSLLIKPSFGEGNIKLRKSYDKLIANFQSLKVLGLRRLGIKKVPKSLGELTLLRYLDLSDNDMPKLPNSITKLVDLLSLNLSGCRYLQELPNSITQLVNLLSLDLSHCRNLQELPRDMSKLYKLRHLLIKWSGLTHMPKGLGKLKDLHTLDWFVFGKGSSSSSKSKGNVTGGLEELSELNNLKGVLTIFVAEESKYVLSEATTAHLATNNLTKLRVVFNKGTKEDEMFLERLKPHGNKLTTMWIFDYGGEKLPSWMLDDQLRCQLPNLIQIKISDSDKIILSVEPSLEDQPWLDMQISDKAHHQVEFIPGFSELKKQLTMGNLRLGIRLPKGDGSRDFTLRNLTIKNKLAASPSREQNQPLILFNTCFPNLVHLTIYDIPELEVLPEEIRDLSSLETLDIKDCPELQAIPDWIDSLTSLEELLITTWKSDCLKIESLPRQISKLSKLTRLVIEGCPKELVERCRKPTGELWPHIQHINDIEIESCPDVNNEIHKFNSKNEQ